MKLKKRILIAPLNWGLGHAARCIPIINELISQNFEPIIASDGNAHSLLKKEFPEIETIKLPSYNISYPRNGKFLKLKLLKDSAKIIKAIKTENKTTKAIIEKYNIDGIISDNRFGVYSNKIPSVYITHQLNVLSGFTTKISTKMHENVIKKFDECWIPDYNNNLNLSGKLGHNKKVYKNTKYIGPLSRFNKINTKEKFALLVLLSGPEPQRTLLEKKLLEELQLFKGNILFVKGMVEEKQTITKTKQFTIYNFMKSDGLELAIQQSNLILSRSGYTTIMDLAKLKKKAFFIPTPGQFEQEYLANRFKRHKIAPFCNQEDFSVELLNSVKDYKGFMDFEIKSDFKNLFSLF